jgi:hypothetical protein
VGTAAVAAAGGLAGLLAARAGEGGRGAAIVTAVAAVGVLAAALVLGWARLVPVALLLLGALYATELAVADAALDAAAPVFASGLLVTAELAYWSLDEQEQARGERGDVLRHVGYVAALGVVSGIVASVLLATADAVRARGVGVDVAGAAAAALALLVVVFVARSRPGDE